MTQSSSMDIPEIRALESRSALIRIPPGTDVPVTPRVRRLIDSSAFRRLASIRQLGLVSMVYPGAVHTRFEHSLGVFHNALLYLQRLRHVERFSRKVSQRDCETFLCAALLHDVGHWPFAHPMEDMGLDVIPSHEARASKLLHGDELSELLDRDWNLTPANIVSILRNERTDLPGKLMSSMLSGPIDVDKVDYLARDSLHAGVPYGHNFDRERLVGGLCLNANGSRLALTEKGRTAAEMLIFSRYVMFSEVYWHHAVRSATAMLQRALYLLPDWLRAFPYDVANDEGLVGELQQAAAGTAAAGMIAGLFGPRRQLYKRVVELSALQRPELHQRIAHRSYEWLVLCATLFAERLGAALGRAVPAHHVLVDAPPRKLEVQFDVELFFAARNEFLPLTDVSPVVRTLAEEQFDRYVKRVRVLAIPELRETMAGRVDTIQLLEQTVEELGT